MCDKKNSVLFTETECLILFLDFKLPDENQVLLKVPKKNNMYSFDLKNVVLSKGLNCLFAKVTNDESNLWHKRLGYINCKTMNKLMKGNLVRGLPSNIFKNDHTFVACQKRKQHKSSCTILNTLDHLGKFDGKDDEGFLVGYSIDSKAFRVYNSKTKKVEENMHVNFLENKPNVAGSGPEWLFDIDSLTNLMNYQSVSTGNRTNGITGSKIHSNVGQKGKEKVSVNAVDSSFSHPADLDDFSMMPNLEDTGIFDDAYDNRDEGVKADYNNLKTVIPGHKQEEGIHYDKVFAPGARIEAIRLFLAYVSFMDFTMYQMDVKSAFLYGIIKEEVYVSQPSGFVDPEFPDRVYKVEKALYGLHQALRACVKLASTPIETHKVLSKDSDGTYIKIHVDHESANCVVKNPVYHSKTKHIEIRHHFIRDSYEKRLIEMVKIHTDFNVADLLTNAFDVTRFQFLVASIGIELKGYLLNDGYADLVQHDVLEHGQFQNSQFYEAKIHAIVEGKAIVISESLVRSDLLFDDEDGITCLTNAEIFENLALMGYEPLSTKLTIQKDMARKSVHISGNATPMFNNMLVKNQAPEGEDEAVNQEEGDRVERAITTDAILEAAQDSDNTIKTQTTAIPNVDIYHGIDTEGHTSGSREDKLEENIELTNIVPTSYDLPLTRGYIPESDEGRITPAELMETCTTLSNRVTQLENEISTTKVVYNKAFITLTNRVKKLESQLKQKRSSAVIYSSDEEGPSVHIKDSPKQGRIIEEMYKDKNINLVSKQGEVQETVEHSRDDDDETLIETLLNIKRCSAKDKVKGIMQETELPKKLKKKEIIQLSLDEELPQKLYAEELAKEGARQEQERYILEKDYEIEREVMKRAGFDLQQGSSKKQRLDQQTKETEKETEAQGDSDQKVEELRLYMRIMPEEDIAIEAILLAIKPLVIIEYKILKERKISTYHITRADGSTRRYTSRDPLEASERQIW
uniref:Retrovirus-related Pol polyprotein from transposon TNT 1-94 n=1 Tax=Tanacetum cinerariifolium TaxID=118510 RepID=A0A6L2LMM0_TANCI|nr:retrovirus-related Pol polyprotein from transposon TNT 1-94 [Tanacetum cinerariifolium]